MIRIGVPQIREHFEDIRAGSLLARFVPGTSRSRDFYLLIPVFRVSFPLLTGPQSLHASDFSGETSRRGAGA
jgi:hypothetical protein